MVQDLYFTLLKIPNQIKSFVKLASKVFYDSSIDKVSWLVSYKHPHETVDGSSIDNIGRFSYGSLLKNLSRGWIFGFYKRGGFTSNI